jgi:hypothetical protein
MPKCILLGLYEQISCGESDDRRRQCELIRITKE